MENPELDRVKSLELLRELQLEHKSIKNNPELIEIQQKVTRHKKQEEIQRKKSQPAIHQIQELRQKFQNALNKLNSTSTRQTALKEAKDLINSHNSIESLKVYISSLSEHHKSKDSSARESEVSLIGYLSQIYKENLVEEGGSLRLLIKLAEIIHSYYKDLNRGVHRSAGTALCDIYKYSLPKSTQSIVFSYMYDPLHSILTTGIDVQVQSAAALTLYIWIEYLKADNDQGNLVLVYSKILPLFSRLRAEFVDLINAIGLLTETCGFSIITENLNAFLSKTVSYLKHPSVNAHSLKTATCQLLSHIGKHLLDNGLNIDPFPDDILPALRELKTDKVPLLQNKARECLKIWEIFRASGLEHPVDLSPAGKAVKRIQPENHFKSIRNLVKLQKEKGKNWEDIKKPESLWGLPKAGYLKKGSGNYFNAASQGNFYKNAEKKLNFDDEIRRKQLSPGNLKVLYKEGGRIVEYEEKEMKIKGKLDEDLEDFKDLKDFNRISNAGIRPLQRKIENFNEINKSEQQNPRVDESCEEFKFRVEEVYTANEFINVSAQRKGLDERSSCKETDFTDAVEKKIEDVKEEDHDEMEEQMMFGFVREESKSTEILNPASLVSKKSGTGKGNLNCEVKVEFDYVEKSENFYHDFTLNPSATNQGERNEDFMKNDKIYSLESENKNSSRNENSKIYENILSSARSTETIKNTNAGTKKSEIVNDEKPSFGYQASSPLHSLSICQNKIQTMKSQTIEIKPVVKRRAIIRDLSIQNQEPFKINQPDNLKQKSNLQISEVSEDKIKGIHSREVQTSINFEDTPRFTASIISEHIETENTTEIFEPILENIEEIQASMEETFSTIEKELKMMEERLVWVDDSCKCIKKYRKVKKILFNTSIISDKSEQTDPDKNLNTINNDQTIDKLTQTWSDILQIAENRNLSQAYTLTLNTNDDLYLLRLMFKTKPCFGLLNTQVINKVFEKLTGIMESKFVENIGIEWIYTALQEGVDLGENVAYGLENIVMKEGKEAEEAKQILDYLRESWFK